MVSSVGYGTVSTPSMQRASVSGEASADGAQQQAKQTAAGTSAQPGVEVDISSEGAAASRMERAENAHAPVASNSNSNTDTDTDSAATTPIEVSPVKAFAYGALGLERPDQPQDERNSFYSAGKWLAAGLTIGGLISLFV